MQNSILNRITEKERERSSFEEQISHVNLSHIDEKEKNMVRMSLHMMYPSLLVLTETIERKALCDFFSELRLRERQIS